MALSLDQYEATCESVLALGTFDGVHLGHQALLKEAASQAKKIGAKSLAFAFSKPPANYLGYPKPLLISSTLKYQIIEQFVDQAIVVDFPTLASMSPEAFVEQVLHQQLNVRGVVVGSDFRFGKDRAGDVALLRTLGQQLNFEVYEVGSVEFEGDPVSSTRIRRAIRAGEIETATQMLGRAPLLYGRVVHGEGRGQKLGYPTANLDHTDNHIYPEQGIFAAIACLKNESFKASVYIGTKPTFDGEAQVTEVHLLEGVFPPLYDETLHVHLIGKIRDDATFKDVDTLKMQIQNDIDKTQELLNGIRLDSYCIEP